MVAPPLGMPISLAAIFSFTRSPHAMAACAGTGCRTNRMGAVEPMIVWVRRIMCSSVVSFFPNAGSGRGQGEVISKIRRLRLRNRVHVVIQEIHRILGAIGFIHPPLFHAAVFLNGMPRG